MVTMKIKVNAGPVAFEFNWEGGTDEIEGVMIFIDDLAAEKKLTPEQLTHSTLAHLPKTGLMKDHDAQKVQIMAILYVVLNAPSRSPDRPGALYRYAADEEVTATLTLSEDKAEIHIESRPITKH
jgi:hypothetical protein